MKYTIIGMSGVAIDFVLYIILTKMGVAPLVANFLSISAGITNNFFLNRSLNFKIHDDVLVRFAMFYITGLMGLILSEILLVGFHYGLDFDTLTSKILTLLPVLLFQYFVNKHFSFGSTGRFKSLLKKISFHWPALIIISVILLVTLTVAKQIPDNFRITSPKHAPDESTHYVFNVEFIANHKSLPVSGKDDIEAYKACRDDPSGIVPCVYSYVFYPGPSYIINAMSSFIIPNVVHISPQKASRIPSIVYGALFAACVYIATYMITRRRLIASLLLVGTGFIPQLLFTTSYTNLDAHSIAISGLLGLSLTMFLMKPDVKYSAVFLGISTGGLLPIAKYNYFVLLVPVVVLLIVALRSRQITRVHLKKIALWSVAAFIVFGAFWYVRNYMLYGDPMGQNFAVKEMAKYHPLGQSHPVDIYSVAHLAESNFFQILFRSYYVNLGSMNYPLDDSRYSIPAYGIVISGMIILYNAAQLTVTQHRKNIIAAGILLTVTFFLVISAVIYNSLIYDFQPQGRYLFPLLIPLALFIAYAIRADRQNNVLALIYASTTLFIFINAVELFMRVYVNNV